MKEPGSRDANGSGFEHGFEFDLNCMVPCSNSNSADFKLELVG